MANLVAVFFSGAIFALTACGLTTPVASLPDFVGEKTVVAPVTGQVTALDGSTVNLGANTGTGKGMSAQVIMFVSETCSICHKETLGLAHDRQTRGVPKNVNFYSVLIGTEHQDAVAWQKAHGVDWVVGLDSGDNLFRTRCPEGLTPCVFVSNPSGTTVKLVGAHSLDEWEQITGRWVF
jgi:hypothetical protein